MCQIKEFTKKKNDAIKEAEVSFNNFIVQLGEETNDRLGQVADERARRAREITEEAAATAAEENNIIDYTIKEVEVRKKRILGGPDIVRKGYKIQQIDQKARRMMDINISPESSPLSANAPAFKGISFARDRAVELTERSGVEFGVEKVINPQPFDDSLIGFEVKRKESIVPFLDAEGMGSYKGVNNYTVAPMTDNRTSSVVNNNSTVLNKVPLSSVDQSNKVVPI